MQVTEAPVFSRLPRLPTLIGQFVVGAPRCLGNPPCLLQAGGLLRTFIP